MAMISPETARKLQALGTRGTQDDKRLFRDRDENQFRDISLTVSISGPAMGNEYPCPKLLSQRFAEAHANYHAIVASDLPRNTSWIAGPGFDRDNGTHSINFPASIIDEIAAQRQQGENTQGLQQPRQGRNL